MSGTPAATAARTASTGCSLAAATRVTPPGSRRARSAAAVMRSRTAATRWGTPARSRRVRVTGASSPHAPQGQERSLVPWPGGGSWLASFEEGDDASLAAGHAVAAVGEEAPGLVGGALAGGADLAEARAPQRLDRRGGGVHRQVAVPGGRRRGRVALPHRPGHLRADLVAACADGRTDQGDRARGVAAAAGEGGHALLDHAGGQPAPARVDG